MPVKMKKLKFKCLYFLKINGLNACIERGFLK